MKRASRHALRAVPLSFVAALLVVLAAGLFTPAPVEGATFVVAAAGDWTDSNPGDGFCRKVIPGDITIVLPCSLRAAIMEANAYAGARGGADTITVPAGTYALTLAGAGEEAAATGDLDITSNLTINGAGAATTIIDGGDLGSVFDVVSGTASISGVTIRNGSADSGGGLYNSTGATLTLTDSIVSGNTAGSGGGIRNNGTLTLTNSTISGNTAGYGGGIYNLAIGTLSNSTVSGNTSTSSVGGGIYNFFGTMAITNGTVGGNTASGGGGGISNYGGTLTLTNSTVSGNTTGGDGGGTANSFNAPLTLTNSTVSGNTAGGNGGGTYSANAPLTLTNSTVSGNTAGSGGGIARAAFPGGAVTLKNTIVANSTSGGNCSGTITSNGNNLDSGTTCALAGSGDLSSADPLLGSLADNGGLTKTHALLIGSPAIDAGDNATCPGTDQRGVARPAGGACDIGAYESSFAATPSPTPAPTPTPTPTATPVGQTPSPTPTTTPTPTATPVGQTPSPTPTSTPTPTATPVGQTPSPTPSPTPTPTATPIGQTPSPTPTATPTPTPTPIGQTPTPSPTETPFKKGDANCDGAVNSVDSLQELRHVAGMQVNQKPGCPEIGGGPAAALAAAESGVFGDVDCDAAVNSVDALKILRYVAGLPVSQPQGCTPIDE